MSNYKCRKCESRFDRAVVPSRFHNKLGVICEICYLDEEDSGEELKALQLKYHKESLN